jgi:uncharacterized protein YydD (DUF2326 family)
MSEKIKEVKETVEGCCGGKGHNDPNHVCKCAEAAKVSGQAVAQQSCGCGHNHSTKVVEAVNTLDDTVALMTSANFADRLRAEYWQTKIRYENLKRLNNMIELSEFGVVEFTKDAFKTPKDLFRAQQKAMGEYLHILELRAIAERIDL